MSFDGFTRQGSGTRPPRLERKLAPCRLGCASPRKSCAQSTGYPAGNL